MAVKVYLKIMRTEITILILYPKDDHFNIRSPFIASSSRFQWKLVKENRKVFPINYIGISFLSILLDICIIITPACKVLVLVCVIFLF